MFIRPRRFRIILAFMLGLGVLVVLLIGGYIYNRANLSLLLSEMKSQAMDVARQGLND